MSLLYMPPELCLWVGDMLDIKDLYSLTLSCRAACMIFTNHLFRFNVRYGNSSALHWAIREKKIYLVRCFLNRYHADVNAVCRGRTPLLLAVETRFTEAVSLLLAQKNINVQYPTEHGRSALWLAAYGGDKLTVEQLIERSDIDINSRDLLHGASPLIAATLSGPHIEVFDLILSDPRTSVAVQDRWGQTLLHRAVDHEQCTIIEKLVSHPNASVNAVNSDMETPIMLAVMHRRSPAIIDLLLQFQHLDCNQADARGRSVIWHAVDTNNDRIIQLLLKREAYIHICRDNVTDEDLLEFAVRRGCEAVVNRLLQQQGCHAQETRTETSFRDLLLALACVAVRNEQANMTRFFCNRLANVNALTEDGQSLLHIAARRSSLAVINVLLEHGSDTSLRDRLLQVPLHCAAQAGQVECIRTLLTEAHRKWDRRSSGGERSVELNSLDHAGQTPLAWASHLGNLSAAKLFLRQSDIQPNLHGIPGRSPLWLACRAGQIDVVKALVQHDAVDINQYYPGSTSPLYVSVAMKHLEIIRLLLSQGREINVNATAYQGRTALSLASADGQVDIVRLLLACPHTEVNAIDEDGRTAIWLAAAGGHVDVVKILKAHPGIKTRLKDKLGQTAYAIAKERKHSSVMFCFRSP